MRCTAHPQAEAYVAALLKGAAHQVAPEEAGCPRDADAAVLLLSAYLSTAKARPCAGLQQLAEWRRSGERAPAIVLSFRSKEHLLRFPENAILRARGTTHLRLPCRRAALLAALEAARPLASSELEEVVHRACTSWGQLAGYTDRLIETAGEATAKDVPSFAKLQDFARRHFSDWLDGALLQAEDCQEQGDTGEMTRLLQEAKRRAPEVAVYHTFGALAHGREADLSNKGLGPLRTTLLLVQQGIAGEEHLQRLLASDVWANFTAALQRTARMLTLVRSSPAALPDALRGEVRTFLKQHDALLRMTEPGATGEQPVAAVQPAAAIEIIDRLQEASRSVLRRRTDARQHAGLEWP